MVYAFTLGGLLAATALQSAAQLPHAALWLVLALYGGLFGRMQAPLMRTLGIALIGAALLGAYAHWRSDVRLQSGLAGEFENRPLVFEATIVDLVQRRDNRVRLQVRLDSADIDNLAVGTLLQLNDYRMPNPSPYRSGQRWRFTARLKRPHGQLNPGAWDTEAWLWAHGHRATGSVKNARFLNEGHDAIAYLGRVREHLADRINTILRDRPAAGFVTALVVGDGSGISRDDWSVFSKTGVTHLVSISGLHITLIAGLVAWAVQWLTSLTRLKRLGIGGRKLALGAGVAAAFAYALLAGFSVPTQRTLYMLIVMTLSYFWRRKPVLESLAYATTAALIFDPFAVLTVGFWLSFSAVALMALGVHRRIGQTRWRDEWVRSQWAVALGLLPALIFAFQQYPWISPLSNAVAIPAVSGLVTPLALIGGLGDWPPALKMAEAIAAYLIEWLKIVARVGVWEQAAPSPFSFGLALGGICLALMPNGVPGRWLGGVAVLPLLFPRPEPIEAGNWKATVLDVGQGLAVIIQTSRHALLYDTGPDWPGDGDSGESVVAPALRAMGIARLDRMIVSHDDNDHAGGALSLIDTLPIAAVQAELPSDHRIWKTVPPAKRRRCVTAQNWRWDAVDFRVLAPDAERIPENDNDKSCVVHMRGRSASLLLPGDVGRAQEQRLVEQWGTQLKSEALIGPHHGSKHSSSAAFIETSDPDLVVFSAGYLNRFRHPHPDALDRYGDRLKLRTDESGAITIESNKGGLEIERLKQRNARFWRGH